MDYKEKYEKAVKAATLAKQDTESAVTIGVLEEIFPELRESEDRKISKAIYTYLKNELTNTEQLTPRTNEFEAWLAWLEKQGEQSGSDVKDYNNIDPHFGKPVDKVEPKFHDGEWITHNTANFVFKIINVGSNGYEVVNRENYKKTISFDNEDNYHLWTIQDAKDGDVLICKGELKYSNGIKYERICLFNNLDNAFFTLTKTSNFVEEYDIDVNIDYPDNTVPATKEQKEILFMAMADAGYTFDFEKKELKKIEQKSAEWSEDDEGFLNLLLAIFTNEHQNGVFSTNGITVFKGNCVTSNRIIAWLISLKDRVQPQSQWKPTKKQIMALRWVLNHIPYDIHKEEISGLFDQIKEL